MPVYDFSSGLGLLNQGISSLGDALGNRTDAQAFSQIGNALQNGRYDQAAALAWQAGKPDIAMKLQGMAFTMGAASGGYPGAPADGGGGGGTTPTSLTKEGGPQPDGKPAPAGAATATPVKPATVDQGPSFVDAAGGGSVNIPAFKQAIAGGESSGPNPYGQYGPLVSAARGRAIGKYQVMPENVGPWTKQYLGTEMTPQQFASSPDAQERLMEAWAADNVGKYGFNGAVNMWFTGKQNPPPTANDRYTTAPNYLAGAQRRYGDIINAQLNQPTTQAGQQPGAPPPPAVQPVAAGNAGFAATPSGLAGPGGAGARAAAPPAPVGQSVTTPSPVKQTPQGPQPATPPTKSGNPSDISDVTQLEGFTAVRNKQDLMKFMGAHGITIDPTNLNWCAALVDAHLAERGIAAPMTKTIPGVGGVGTRPAPESYGGYDLRASSFLNWGQPVAAGGVQQGDVVVNRSSTAGTGAASPHGHVGLATGQTRMGASGPEIEMISGNVNGAVQRQWVPASQYAVRRGQPGQPPPSGAAPTPQAGAVAAAAPPRAPPTPAPGNVAAAGATQTPGGPQPTQLPPTGPPTQPTPTQPGSMAAPGLSPMDAMGAPVTGGYRPGADLTPRTTPTATTPAAAPPKTASQPTTGPAAVGTPGSPVSPPPPTGAAKDVPAPQSSAEPPAAAQPKSWRTISDQPAGPYGPPSGPRNRGTGTTFAEDFGPGKGQMWGPGGTVVGAGGPGSVPGPGADAVSLGQQALARKGFDPTVAPFAQGTSAQPWSPNLPASAFGPGAGGAPPPGAGAVPAALGGPGGGAPPPGAMPPPGGQAQPAGLGARLQGLIAPLLNIGSMTPPGGVPGVPSPAQRLGYGAPAPIPGQPGFPGVGPVGGGGGGGGVQPAAYQPPAGGAGAPAAQPAAAQPAADPALAQIDARIQAATQRELALRQYSQRMAFYSPDAAKASEAEADKLSDQINSLVKEREARVSKSGETAETAVSGQASKRIEQLGTSHAQLTGATGVGAITDNINAMERNLNNAIAGYGTANNLWQSIFATLAPYDPKMAGLAAGSQEFERRGTQELAQMAEQLFNEPGSHLNRSEYNALRDGTFKLSDNPYVAYRLLEMSRARALNLLTQHNANVDAAAKAYGKYGGAEAKELYHVEPTEEMKSPGKDYKPPPDPNEPGSANKPIVIPKASFQTELPKLEGKHGTNWVLDDGSKSGTIP